MVFFTCDYCNESLKKNQVDKHCYKCRHCESVTCVDCSQVFWGNDFIAHTSCISEAEKYEKSLYKGKQKLSPQDSWMQSIETAVSKYDDAPISIQPHLQKLLEFNNIPRNKNKFVNFLKNSLKLHSSSVIDELWNFVSSYYNKPTSSIQEIDNTSKESNQSAISNVLLDEIKDKTIQINKCEEPSNGKMKESKKSKKKRKIENEESEVQKRKCEQISGNE